ncbi:CBS domain-containing protein [Pseudonocardia sp. KRD291]|uniref:CBS domain-containing protein n=1 Tax=Pseudonocardia sp. KRD291 TaxID=2792007 RepID=UPI001C4A4D34|nr:CBS domain-containing protein [Pseudonocardia sp. KRD291]MBW0102343.1 CBS domain-containing protein [Pseudonocardia sp. KRD291]
MKVADILKIKGDAVRTVPSRTPVPEAVRLLAGPPPIGALVVSDDEGRTVHGIISERDLVRRLGTDGTRLLELTVADVMTRHVVTCTLDNTLDEVMAEMTRRRHRHLPVVRNDRLVGLVSIGDVVRHRLAEMRTETGVLRDIYLASH